MQCLGVRLRFRLELVRPHRASSILQPKSFAKFARYSHFCRLPQISRNCERNLTPPKYRKTFCAILVWANGGGWDGWGGSKSTNMYFSGANVGQKIKPRAGTASTGCIVVVVVVATGRLAKSTFTDLMQHTSAVCNPHGVFCGHVAALHGGPATGTVCACSRRESSRLHKPLCCRRSHPTSPVLQRWCATRC